MHRAKASLETVGTNKILPCCFTVALIHSIWNGYLLCERALGSKETDKEGLKSSHASVKLLPQVK